MSGAPDRNAVVVELGTLEKFVCNLPTSVTEPQVPDLREELGLVRRQMRRLMIWLTESTELTPTLDGGHGELKRDFYDLETRIDELETASSGRPSAPTERGARPRRTDRLDASLSHDGSKRLGRRRSPWHKQASFGAFQQPKGSPI